MSISTTLRLAKELQRHITLLALVHPLKIESASSTNSFDDIACHMYSIEKEPSLKIASTSEIKPLAVPVPLLESLHCLLDYTDTYVDLLISSETNNSEAIWIAFTDGMQLLLDLVELVRDSDTAPEPVSVSVDVNRDMQRWLRRVLAILEVQVSASFWILL